MTNQELITLLLDNKIEQFNKFRREHQDATIDLSNANFMGSNLTRANLSGVILYNAKLIGAKINKEQVAMLPELLGIEVIED